MAIAHLLFGYIGAGKTVLAKKLEQQHNAVRFTPDEWMSRLFGEDPPERIFPERAAAILALMQPVWTRCLVLGVDVVLDYGFWRRFERDNVRKTVRRLGASAILYAVSSPEDEARNRTARRNRAPGRSLYIAPATFDALRERFEPLDDDEEHVVISEKRNVSNLQNGTFARTARFPDKSEERRKMEPELRRGADGLSHSKPGSVDQQSEGSFPASDAPSFSSNIIGAPRDRRSNRPTAIVKVSAKKAKSRKPRRA